MTNLFIPHRRAQARPGAGNGHSKLNDEAVRTIRAAHAAGISRTTLAKLYSVSVQTISTIVQRRSWRHVE